MRLKNLLFILKKLRRYKFFLFLSFVLISEKSISCEPQLLKKEILFIENKLSKNKELFLVELAKNELEKQKGLQCKKYLGKNEGMLFVWSKEDYRNFWMKNTYIPLDLIFINSQLEVIEVYFDARPFSEKLIRSANRAKFVLELNAGIFKKLGFVIGDRITFKKVLHLSQLRDYKEPKREKERRPNKCTKLRETL